MPDFSALDFVAARPVERDAEVKLADPNPDAPPLRAYWWQHQELVVAMQDPEPGAEVHQWDSVGVTLVPPGSPVGASVRPNPPHTRTADAPEEEQSTADA